MCGVTTWRYVSYHNVLSQSLSELVVYALPQLARLSPLHLVGASTMAARPHAAHRKGAVASANEV